jgi:hypothetical protein
MRFSQRMGHRPIKNVLQIESIDDELKIRLWNILKENFFDNLYHSTLWDRESALVDVCKFIWIDFFNLPIDQVPISGNKHSPDHVLRHLRKWFFETEWYSIFDFLEFITPFDDDYVEFCNKALQRELSAYRIINGQVTQITSEGEIAEIEEAISVSDQWKSVNIHLTAALDFLADRKNPDYRNSIKESISAVESLCLKIGDNANGKFGDALTEIEKKIPLHGSLKRAFTALYGYTSDAGGIRHALIDDDTTPTFEDAKFMLVSCSAFINYLKAKMQL